MTQVQRRVTVCHEIIHIERGIIPGDDAEESRVELLTAERLISTEQLVDALRWHRYPSVASLADTLWVDLSTVRTRLAKMTNTEQKQIESLISDAA